MKKLIVESKWFQRSFLKAVRKRIFKKEDFYCCKVFTWHRFFCNFYQLKVVNENNNSSYLLEYFKGAHLRKLPFHQWFDTRSDRLAFLDECLQKLK
jgi:hypothetical protein